MFARAGFQFIPDMTFTVTYRNHDGSRAEECFDAESRDALFKLLESKGIKPIRIFDGEVPKARRRVIARPRMLYIAVIILGAIAGVSWWAMSSKGKAPPPAVEKPQSSKPEAATKRPTPKPTPVPEPAQEPLTWPEKSPHPDGEWRHGEGPRSIAVTNGCLVTYPHYPGVQMVLPHPAYAAPFETLLDNEIARIVTAKLGDDFIDVPLPKNFDEKFAESLLVPIEINEDDTPEKAELKRQVKEARKILVEAVKRGESPRQILTEEAKTLRRLMQTRDNYQRILNEQIENGASDQEINDTVNAANKMLEREGSDAKVMLPWKTRLRIKQGKADGTILD